MRLPRHRVRRTPTGVDADLKPANHIMTVMAQCVRKRLAAFPWTQLLYSDWRVHIWMKTFTQVQVHMKVIGYLEVTGQLHDPKA